ncbi:MAG: PIN domain-containing protein [Spirochaetota bacterium]
MINIFIDTSAFYASFDPKDANYHIALDFFQEIRENTLYRLYAANLVFYETITLVRARIGITESIAFGQNLFQSKGIRNIFVDRELEAKALNIFNSHKDKDYSFVDCASFSVMKELDITKAFSFDSHFKQFGFEMLQQLLLPFASAANNSRPFAPERCYCLLRFRNNCWAGKQHCCCFVLSSVCA